LCKVSFGSYAFSGPGASEFTKVLRPSLPDLDVMTYDLEHVINVTWTRWWVIVMIFIKVSLCIQEIWRGKRNRQTDRQTDRLIDSQTDARNHAYAICASWLAEHKRW